MNHLVEFVSVERLYISDSLYMFQRRIARRMPGDTVQYRQLLGTAQHGALHKDLETIYRNNSEVRDDTLTITGGEYLEVIATRK
jgi:hypothetical protein